jgi:Zn-dependent protease with chaperone function
VTASAPGLEHLLTLWLAVTALFIGGPHLLAHWRWLQRRPRTALWAWAACGLSSGVGLICALWQTGSWLVQRQRVVAVPDSAAAWSAATAVLMGGWMVLRLVHTVASRRRARRRHLRAVHLVGRWDDGLGAVVVDADTVTAYCVPGLLRSTVVVTRGALERADEAEVAAVLAHEKAHARGRHDLLVTAFLAWQRAFPFLGSTRVALAGVSTATEMLADEAAARRAGPSCTIRALRRFDPAGPPGQDETAWVPSPTTLVRVRHLLGTPSRGLRPSA